MRTAWLDANVILRFLTKRPPALAERARKLLEQAEAGRVRFRIRTVIAAEVVWVLGSKSYGYDAARIADAVGRLLRLEGVTADEPDLILSALQTMADRNVPFVDAYLAASAAQSGEPVCTFDDEDFKRLDVPLFS